MIATQLNDTRLGAPVFESISQDPKFSFYWHCHDFPAPIARWNYHPEYELHLIRYSEGNYFVGDYIGRFGPGNLVLVGPNIPHAWLSDPDDARPVIKGRDVVLQFKGEWLEHMMTLCPELNCLSRLIEDSAQGVEFMGDAAARCAELLVTMGEQDNAGRLLTMLTILRSLSQGEYRILASCGYGLDAKDTSSVQVDAVLRYIHDHFHEELRMSTLAAQNGMTPSTFSRFFKHATGDTFVAFLRRIRIGHACRLLLEGRQSIADICFQVGYNNLSNFNRHFREQKGMTPRQYQQSTADRVTNNTH
ncbi:helix-turn-helix domain-containing protein [Chromohalobacter sarecensis]|uniref:Helix-turn-helix domain-containing protein n=1 Tax=Chromohalobacter sarecensis TaxID=245294 RepID=A0ABV9CW69_9GAMM|nr:AraC family transcriptional regulator [Chromohalobacter sarecensis]MCK0715486.1 AraC family transcriptional regulator [Chromohalobacter sarecensis]